MDVQEATSVDSLQALADEWWELWERCPRATPFQSPAWMLPWWRHIFGGGRVWALVLRHEGRLVGLAQFFFYGRPEQRHLTLAGAGITDYLDVLLDPQWETCGVAVIRDRVEARRGEWEDFEFPDLPEGSPLLANGAPREACACCPVVTLPAEGAEHARRARKRVARRAQWEVNQLPWMKELFRLHAVLWQAREESGVTAADRLQRHYREAAAAMHQHGLLRLFGLRIDGEPAAALFAFAGHGRCYAYLDGFDPRFAKRSPGTVLLSIAMEHAADEGLAEFDFLRKQEQFKYQWGARDRQTWRLAGRAA